MCLRIQAVVDGITILRAQALIVLHYRTASAVGEDKVVLWNEQAKWVGWILLNSCQGRRRIHVPECDLSASRAALQHFPLEQLIVCSDAAVLDDQIRTASLGQNFVQIAWSLIDPHGRVFDGWAIPMLLPLVNIWLGKGNLMSEPVQVLVNSAIVSRSPIPIARSQTGTEDVDVHSLSSPAHDKYRQVGRRDERKYAARVRFPFHFQPIVCGPFHHLTDVEVLRSWLRRPAHKCNPRLDETVLHYRSRERIQGATRLPMPQTREW